MAILIFSAILAAVFLIVALLLWVLRWVIRRRVRLGRVLKWTAICYLGFLPLVIFVGFPLLSARLIAYSGTRPMDARLQIDPGTYGCSFENVSFRSRDGLKLQGWWLAGDEDKPVIVLAHGLFRDRKEVVERACQLNRLGHSALAYDLRRHGASQGEAVSLGYLERWDVLGAYDLARGRSKAGVVVLGVSMGATATLLALPDLGRDVLAVVADSPFASLDETVRRHVKLFLGLPGFPFTPIFNWYLGRLAGFPPARLNTVETVSSDRSIPILLIYGADDDRMPADTARQVYNAIPIPLKELVTFPGAGHAAAWKVDPKRYVSVIEDFLQTAQTQK